MHKEKVFISAVVYLDDDPDTVVPFFRQIYQELSAHFEHFEIIAVDDCCQPACSEQLRKLSQNFENPLTIIHFHIHQGREPAMNAGLDACVGDYIYQFEGSSLPLDSSLIWKAYETMNGKYDILSVCFEKHTRQQNFFNRIIKYSTASPIQTGAELFSIITRRTLNRVHTVSEYLPYRKAAFTVSGLEAIQITCDGLCTRKENISLMIESILLYTKIGYKLSITASILMLVLALTELLYILVTYCLGSPIEGWTTMTAFITFSFAGTFLLLTIVIKYLSMILEMLFQKQKYLIGSVEKIQK